MQNQEPGRHLEVHFTDHDRAFTVDLAEEDPKVAGDSLAEAIGADSPEDAQNVLQTQTSGATVTWIRDRT
jgi:hypothetical protein